MHEVKPGLPLGFMTGDRFYEGYDFDRWAGVLAGPGQARRSAGGPAADSTRTTSTAGLAGKSHDIGRQVSLLPPRRGLDPVGDRELPLPAAEEVGPHHGAGGGLAHRGRLHGRGVQRALGQRRAAGRIRAPGRPHPPGAALLRPPGRALGAKTPGRNPRRPGTRTPRRPAISRGGNWFAFGRFLGESPRLFEIGVPIDYSPQGRRGHAPLRRQRRGLQQGRDPQAPLRRRLHGCPGPGAPEPDGLRRLDRVRRGSGPAQRLHREACPSTR